MNTRLCFRECGHLGASQESTGCLQRRDNEVGFVLPESIGAKHSVDA